MADKSITILTDCCKDLGSGHLQRMLSLLWHLNSIKNIKAFIHGKKIREHVPDELRPFFIPEIHPSTDLIIRDMRDSTEDEIKELQLISKVLVIDDLGEGREKADYRMNLLPNLVDSLEKNSIMNFFIYGFNFIKSVSTISNQAINREIDVLFYPGFQNDSGYTEKVLSLIPDCASYSLLSNIHPYIINKGCGSIKTDRSYSQMLLSAKSVISHFGITLFEAAISGCSIIALNPTQYHSDLTEIAKKLVDVTNLGLYKDLDSHRAADVIKRLIAEKHKKIIYPEDIYSKMIQNLNNFSSYIISII